MNITKGLSEEVAARMVQPIKVKIDSLCEERRKVASKAILETIPADLKLFFEKHTGCFIRSTSATLLNGTQEVRIGDLDYFPAYNTYYPRVEVGRITIETVEKLRLKIEKLKDEKEKTFESIVSTLLSLRTFKRVKEQFPEAYVYMSKYEEEGKTELSLPIEAIISTIKKYK